jgi:DNA polymerase-3 subunit chi
MSESTERRQPRIDFYEMTGRFTDPLQVACVLVGKAWPGITDIAVVGGADQIAALDERLWETPSGRFLPHGIDDPAAPIRLHARAPDSAELLINLDAAAPLPSGRYRRILEIVPPDDDAKPALRRRWTAWKQAGAELHHHRLR